MGREGKDGLSGFPNDAVSGAKKDVEGLSDTTNTNEAAERAAGNA